MNSNNKFLLLVVISATVFMLTSCEAPETTQPVRKDIEDAVFASGYMEQENNRTVSAKVEGILLSLPIAEGDQVNKNEVIATIENEVQDNQLQDALIVYEDAANNAAPDSPQLQNLLTQIEQAKQQLEFDKINYNRYKALWQKQSIAKLEFEKMELQYKNTQSQLLALEKNYQDLENNLVLNEKRSRMQVKTQKSLLQDYQLTADASGQVIRVYKKPGELVRRGEAIAQIGSGDYLVKLFVSEEDIPKVNLGQAVAIRMNTYPDQIFQATVSKIYPGFDEMEQSYVVEAQFEQLPPKVFSGTQLQANIKIGNREQVLVIPSAYVSRGNFVTLENGQQQEVVTGSKNSQWTEIISGLADGEMIIKP